MEQLHYLPGQNFACESCTKCCRGWRIRVDEASRTGLERIGGKRSLVRREGRLYTLQMADASCTFLQPDRRCSAHSCKPQGCRQFPLRLCRTPDGVFVGASFYCSSIQTNSGPSLAEQDVTGFLDDLPLVGDEPLLVEGSTRLPWAAYRVLEGFLEAELSDPESGLGRGLWALCQAVASGVPRLEPEQLLSLLEASQEALSPPNEPFVLLEPGLAAGIVARAGGGGRPTRAGVPAEPLGRYLRALIFRKFLVTRRPVLHNLAALFLAPLLFGAWPEDALDRCEYRVYTHGACMDEVFAEVARGFLWTAS